jgi:predicted ester cyclase
MADAKTIIQQLLEEPWKGNWGVIDEYVAPDYIGHDPAEPGPIRGIDGFKGNIQKYIDGFSDARITVDEQIAEGNKVATRWTGRGTHSGEIAGIAPTGREVTVTGITIARIENGKLIEDHSTWDTLGMLVQLGAIPMPATA